MILNDVFNISRTNDPDFLVTELLAYDSIFFFRFAVAAESGCTNCVIIIPGASILGHVVKDLLPGLLVDPIAMATSP